MIPSEPNHDFVREIANRPGNLRLAAQAEKLARRNRIWALVGAAAVGIVAVVIFA